MSMISSWPFTLQQGAQELHGRHTMAFQQIIRLGHYPEAGASDRPDMGRSRFQKSRKLYLVTSPESADGWQMKTARLGAEKR